MSQLPGGLRVSEVDVRADQNPAPVFGERIERECLLAITDTVSALPHVVANDTEARERRPVSPIALQNSDQQCVRSLDIAASVKEKH